MTRQRLELKWCLVWQVLARLEDSMVRTYLCAMMDKMVHQKGGGIKSM